MLAGVSEAGEVTVEGHYVGRLEGLAFLPDPRALGLEGRAVRGAAQRALAPEVYRRLARIAAAMDFSLERDGRVMFEGAAVARLAPSAVLKPRLALIGAEQVGEAARRAALARLEGWLGEAVARELAPLAALETAWRAGALPNAARGLAYRLIESGGALDRRAAGDLLATMTPEARAALAAFGVRFGRCTIFMPALLAPQAAALHAILRHWTRPGARGLPFLPRRHASSAAHDPAREWGAYAAAGFRPAGRAAVRIDRLERIAAQLSRAQSAGGAPDPKLRRLLKLDEAGFAAMLEALGYRRQPPRQPGAPPRWRAPAAPRSAKGRAEPLGPFADLADMLPRK